MKRLFVSFTFSDNKGSGNGNHVFDLENFESIENICDIRKLQSDIENQQNTSGVIINNIIMLPLK